MNDIKINGVNVTELSKHLNPEVLPLWPLIPERERDVLRLARRLAEKMQTKGHLPKACAAAAKSKLVAGVRSLR